jgi:hypothetical protein
VDGNDVEAAHDGRSYNGCRSADKDGVEDDPSYGKGHGPPLAEKTSAQTAEEPAMMEMLKPFNRKQTK